MTIGDLGAFRREFRGWLAANITPEWQTAPFPRTYPPADDADVGTDWARSWQRRLHEDGWLAPGWPPELGGRGLDLDQRLVMLEEIERVSAPMVLGFQGIDILGPALIEHGTAAQQDRFLPRILTGDDIWCQGYSEPGSGSDLASVRTMAVRDGDEYVVNGQKVWTSYGGRANWCFLLARTGSPGSRSRGITFLLTSMDVPGVEWRPIRQMTGDSEFGELFLTDVRIPIDLRVGEEGRGWTVATHSLGHERLLMSSIAPLRRRMDGLMELCRQRAVSAPTRDVVASLECRLRAATYLQSSALRMARVKDPRFPAWASMTKVMTSELRQAIADAAGTIIGMDAVSNGPATPGSPDPFGGDVAARWAYELVEGRAGTIYAGTSEIQRNIIAEVGLGLPR